MCKVAVLIGGCDGCEFIAQAKAIEFIVAHCCVRKRYQTLEVVVLASVVNEDLERYFG